MSDSFKDHQPGLESPAGHAIAITPSDALALSAATRAIYVGGGGALRVAMVSGAVVTLAGVQAGQVYPLRLVQVLATGTTATGLVGLL
jgi:hypothetical protein